MMNLHLKYHGSQGRYSFYPPLKQWQTPGLGPIQTQVSALQDVYLHIPFCQSLCNFCGCNIKVTKSRQDEEIFFRAVVKEARELKKITDGSVQHLILGGGTPTFFGVSALERWLPQIFLEQFDHFDTKMIELDPRVVSCEDMKGLVALGFNRFSFGVQDFDLKVLEYANRHHAQDLHDQSGYDHLQSLCETIRACDQKSEIAFDFIYGLPLQCAQTMATWYDKLKTLAPDYINFYPMASVPWQKTTQAAFGFSQKVDHGEADEQRLRQRFELYEMGKEIFMALGMRNMGHGHFFKSGSLLDKSYQRKTLQYSLMGYFKGDYLPSSVGLGPSAISWNSSVCSQNHKSVDAYRFALDKNRSPVMNDHHLSDRDRLKAKALHDLMTTHSFELPDFCEPKWPQAFDSFMSDGLLYFDDHLKIFRLTSERGVDFMKPMTLAMLRLLDE